MDDRKANGEAPRFSVIAHGEHACCWSALIVDADNVSVFGGNERFVECHEEDAEWICAALNAADRREKASGIG